MEMKIGNLNLHNTNLAHVAGHHSQHIKVGLPQAAFSGRSNVGKSSLINSLLGRKALARISSVPGKTITCNYYSVDKSLYLVDLPGYGYAKRSKSEQERWSELTEAYFGDNAALKIILQLIDSRAGITDGDKVMLRWMNHYDIPYIVVCTKCDRLNKTELDNSVEKILKSQFIRNGTDIILYSSTKNKGRDQLWERILNYAL